MSPFQAKLQDKDVLMVTGAGQTVRRIREEAEEHVAQVYQTMVLALESSLGLPRGFIQGEFRISGDLLTVLGRSFEDIERLRRAQAPAVADLQSDEIMLPLAPPDPVELLKGFE